MEAKDQIEILKKAKQLITRRDTFFVCVAIQHELRVIHNIDTLCAYCPKYIPLLTSENAQKACKKHKLKMPVRQWHGGWWATDNIKSRICFINWMIKELEKEL